MATFHRLPDRDFDWEALDRLHEKGMIGNPRGKAKKRVEDSLAFVKTLTRAQIEGTEDKDIARTAGGNNRKMKGAAYLQQFALPNFYFFSHHGLRHPAPPRRSGRQARLPGPHLDGLSGGNVLRGAIDP